ncbi:MAG: hypothetical protein P9M14_09275 [Candidatus Alcyoniella australis]|nr:hypothetical protein [Candidatus Alcyoniella australis]
MDQYYADSSDGGSDGPTPADLQTEAQICGMLPPRDHNNAAVNL